MENISGKKWVCNFISLFLFGAILLCIVSYLIDPFMYYRMGNDKKFLHSRFVNMGIIKNYNYDSAFIGSSMIQNFDMPYFRKYYSNNPVKLVVGGMTINEILKMYTLSQKHSDANEYIINVDINQFNTTEPLDMSTSKFPQYLYNDSRFDDIKYLLGYEVWLKFIPVNLIINTISEVGIELPEKIEDNINIDKIEDWSKDYSFGKEVVTQNYLRGTFTTSKMDTNNMHARMTKNIDKYLAMILIQKKSGQTITFGFPPYSALYWYKTYEDDTFNTLMEIKKYFIDQCAKHEEVRVVDLQSISEITNLNFYKDTTHYDTSIQQIYSDAIISDKFDISPHKFNLNKLKLEDLIKKFEKENRELLRLKSNN